MLRPFVQDAEAGFRARLASADQGLHWIGSSTQVYTGLAGDGPGGEAQHVGPPSARAGLGAVLHVRGSGVAAAATSLRRRHVRPRAAGPATAEPWNEGARADPGAGSRR
ncbi:MAG TPA: hypothetical protein VLK84_00710, partial [Longimicrobium sp.]|nr:hypothetical protein [Longimicrobium sp.]